MRAIEDFWFRERLPSKAAAVRELLRRALATHRRKSNQANGGLSRTLVIGI
jgi:hypothetical protein